jgi:hypothetical protein
VKTAIHKFPLRITETQQVQMCSLEYLHVGLQNDQLCLWALVNTDQPGTVKTFHVVPTGGSPDLWWRHLGTVVQKEGWVWHLYEEYER